MQACGFLQRKGSGCGAWTHLHARPRSLHGQVANSRASHAASKFRTTMAAANGRGGGCSGRALPKRNSNDSGVNRGRAAPLPRFHAVNPR